MGFLTVCVLVASYGTLFLAPYFANCDQDVKFGSDGSDRLERMEHMLLKQQATLVQQERTIKNFEAIVQEWEARNTEWQKMAEDFENLKEHFSTEAATWQMEKKLWKKEEKDLADEISLLRNKVATLEKAGEHVKSGNHKTQSKLARYDNGDVNPDTDDMDHNAHDAVPLRSQRGTQDRVDSHVYTRSDEIDPKTHDVATRSDDPDPYGAVLSQVEQRLDEVSAEVQALKNDNVQRYLSLQGGQGSVYVRWGRSSCPNSTHLVYSGIMGGSSSASSGAATNYLCLTLTPVLTEPHPHEDYAFLVGGEYQTKDQHENNDPLCAVCRSPRATTVMLPTTNVCQPGWTLEYSGFLMAGYHGHTAGSEYVCVDAQFEERAGSEANKNGKLLYYTVAHCGSLPCPPYVNGKIVTCAVCSK